MTLDPVNGISGNLAFFTQLQAARGGALESQVKQLQGRLERQADKPLALGTAGASAAPKTKKEQEAQLMKSCQDFESIFWNFMLQAMRQATPKSGFLDSSQEQELFTSMQDEELSKSMAQRGGLGISRMLFEQLKKTI
jgi:flagellar protein FlgJ